ncbi:hypothetical protein QUH73_20280 [Labilibaculum sp. K2S]|uniref:hypothetical protein n=1 Tax=Labilibaculum sp. K2S TaxID=3056386 RepID=UPI0025A42ECC|nr:hypothetical protein [Labilibaculum sp. K2S]MDM8162167.1 hypothetical protein [Labilibaculum sp. K2S]
MRYIVILFGLVIFACVGFDAQGQMIEGNYPFQIVDSLVFEEGLELLQIKVDTKPKNFISTIEARLRNGLEIKELDKKYFRKRIKEVHSATNKRDFVAGISNYSTDTIFIPIQDGSLISIIEAKDTEGVWKPIQYWPISGCGNSYYSECILPNQTLLFTVKKNFGSIQTSMRLRLHGTNTIFVSKEYVGTISLDMFKLKENVVQDYRHILCDKFFFLESPRFGNFYREADIEIEIIEETD